MCPQRSLGSLWGIYEVEWKVRENAGWKQVDFHGWVDERHVNSVLQRSLAGIVTLKPTPNYLYAMPVKLFEYMRAGVAGNSFKF